MTKRKYRKAVILEQKKFDRGEVVGEVIYKFAAIRKPLTKRPTYYIFVERNHKFFIHSKNSDYENLFLDYQRFMSNQEKATLNQSRACSALK